MIARYQCKLDATISDSHHLRIVMHALFIDRHDNVFFLEQIKLRRPLADTLIPLLSLASEKEGMTLMDGAVK